MKVKSIIVVLLLMVAGVQTAWTQNVMRIWHDGNYELYSISRVDSIQFDSIKLVTRITLTPKELTIKRGKSAEIIATALPVSASNREVTWRSSRPEVATVEASGRNATITAVGVGSCVIVCSATDGSGVYAECPVTVQDNHEYVDLGLPSGTLWATCNVGANTPEESGDCFAWGETESKSDYIWETYKYCKGDSITLTKYCWESNRGYNGFTDNKMELDPEDDAATANWGCYWQMPNKEQMDELLYGDYVKRAFTTLNGVNGLSFTSNSNGKSIFLPAAGFLGNPDLEDDFHVGTCGDYYSRSLDPSADYRKPYYRYFDLDRADENEFYHNYSYDQRYYGRYVRPVRKQ